MVHAALVWSLLALGAETGRPFPEIQADIQQALRQETAASTFSERAVAVSELAKIHREIVADKRFPESPTLKKYRSQIAIRLFSVQNDLQRQLRRDRSKIAAKPAINSPTSVPVAPGDSQLIDEQTATLASHLALAGYFQGGPVQLTASGSSAVSRGGGIVLDNGQGLVDLIQRTIKPEFWDVNGGPGTIVYFAQLRCLVVRASAEVHHEIGGLAGGLRAAGP